MNEVFLPVKMKEVGQDILLFDFFTEAYCDFLLTACDSIDIWEPNPEDEYKTQDLDFEKYLPPVYEMVREQLKEEINPVLNNYWMSGEFDIEAMFALKYTMDTQRTLSLHHDDSYVSFSIKLNNLYRGAELEFPRQRWSNKDIPIGKLLCWPSQLTHPHECSPLEAGNKYSMTIWTKELK